MNLDFIERVIAIFTNLFVCFGVIFAWWQWCLMKKGKKQSTIEFYSNIRKDFIESLKQIDEKFSKVQVIEVEEVKDDLNMLYAIREYLSCMERFSVDIKTKVYDIEVFKEMIGATLSILWFNKLKKIIDFLRIEYKSPNAYKNFENLVFELNKLHKSKI